VDVGLDVVDLAAVVDRGGARLGTDAPRRLSALESGAERQRAVAAADGFEELCRSLVLEPPVN
jgi:hypothetical protein